MNELLAFLILLMLQMEFQQFIHHLETFLSPRICMKSRQRATHKQLWMNLPLLSFFLSFFLPSFRLFVPLYLFQTLISVDKQNNFSAGNKNIASKVHESFMNSNLFRSDGNKQDDGRHILACDNARGIPSFFYQLCASNKKIIRLSFFFNCFANVFFLHSHMHLVQFLMKCQ